VKLEETVSSFERLVAGEFDQYPSRRFSSRRIDGVDRTRSKLSSRQGAQGISNLSEAVLFEGDADSVVAPAYDERLESLADMPVMALLGAAS